jgi:WD40 repeat protein
MKTLLRTGFMLSALVLYIFGSFQPASGQPDPNKPQQRMESIERPILNWDYDGKRILGHVEMKVILWDATTGKVLHKMIAHQERIFSVRFSPDGLHAFTSSWMGSGGMLMYKSKDTRIILWNLTTGEKKADFPDQVAGEFSPDGKLLLTFSGPRPGKLDWFDAVVWDAAHGAKLTSSTLDEMSSPYEDRMYFSTDGRSFAHIKSGRYVNTNSSLGVLYDAINGREMGRSARQNGGHRFTSNGELASLDSDRAILTDLHSGRVQNISHGLKSVRGAAWTHDGKRVATFGDGEIKIWDIESRKTTAGVKAQPITTNIAIVSPDNQRLAMEFKYVEHPELRLYDMKTGKEIERVALVQWGHVIGFAPDSKTILVGGPEFVIYDAENGKEIRRLKLLDDVSFSYDWDK